MSAPATIHHGISQIDLRRLVRDTGGTVEDVRRTGEYRVRYPHMPRPSGCANGRRKDVNRAIVNYVREAIESAPRRTEAPVIAPTLEPGATFAVSLKRLREDRGLSHAELSEAVGCERMLIGEWERGESFPATTHMARLFKALPLLKEFAAAAPAPAAAPEAQPTETFKESLRRLMRKHGIAAAELAKRVGSSTGTMWGAMTGRIVSEPVFLKMREALPGLVAPERFAKQYRYSAESGRHEKAARLATPKPAAPVAPQPTPAPVVTAGADPSGLGGAFGAALAAQARAEADCRAAEAMLAEARERRDAAKKAAAEAHAALISATIGSAA